jgi:hypothetical protein
MRHGQDERRRSSGEEVPNPYSFSKFQTLGKRLTIVNGYDTSRTARQRDRHQMEYYSPILHGVDGISIEWREDEHESDVLQEEEHDRGCYSSSGRLQQPPVDH